MCCINLALQWCQLVSGILSKYSSVYETGKIEKEKHTLNLLLIHTLNLSYFIQFSILKSSIFLKFFKVWPTNPECHTPALIREKFFFPAGLSDRLLESYSRRQWTWKYAGYKQRI